MCPTMRGTSETQRPLWWPRLETEAGETLVIGHVAVTPVAKTWGIGYALPARPDGADASLDNGFTYRRSWPAAVVVSSGGRESRMPITDMTRLAQAAIVLMAAVWACWVWKWTR
jgi:hypothetical protein